MTRATVLEAARGAAASTKFDQLDKDAAEAKRADNERRNQQRAENVAIGQGPPQEAPLPEIFTEEQLHKRAVYIVQGRQIALLPKNEGDRVEFYTGEDFTGYALASRELVEDAKRSDGKRSIRSVSVVQKWMFSTVRITVQTRTFAPGQGRFCHDPEGTLAINSFTPWIRKAPRDWRKRVKRALEHIAYLIPDKAQYGLFLDWLAHIEQHPGVLPHHGWLFITPSFGVGRNWLASLLVRVWPGYVAPSLNLTKLLKSDFNEPLKRKVLAIVDEIVSGETGNARYTLENALRQMVTEGERWINEKNRPQYLEHNAVRWLLFSNHENALPLSPRDRRFEVVANPVEPKPLPYYTELYSLLTDRDFIASFAMYLSKRDVTSFNPGRMPTNNAAKQAVIEASKSELRRNLEFVVEHWGAEVAATYHLCRAAGVRSEEPGQARSFGHVMRELGCERFPVRVKVAGTPEGVDAVWIIRNFALYRPEVNPHDPNATPDEKKRAIRAVAPVVEKAVAAYNDHPQASWRNWFASAE
jgi:hypothetical protein